MRPVSNGNGRRRVNFFDLKNYGNWASDTAAQVYVDQSINKKMDTAHKLSYGGGGKAQLII